MLFQLLLAFQHEVLNGIVPDAFNVSHCVVFLNQFAVFVGQGDIGLRVIAVLPFPAEGVGVGVRVGAVAPLGKGVLVEVGPMPVAAALVPL